MGKPVHFANASTLEEGRFICGEIRGTYTDSDKSKVTCQGCLFLISMDKKEK